MLLGDLVTLQTGPFGSSLHQSDYVANGVPLVNPMHIAGGRIRATEEHTVSADTARRLSDFRMSAGDVVIGRRGEMGRCAVVTPREQGWLCGTGSMVIRCGGALVPTFLQRLLSSREIVEYLGKESVGSTMANLNQKVLLSVPVRVPPVAEQQRIVDAIDELMPQHEAGVAELFVALGKLIQYRQSLLKAAVEGDLTAGRGSRWPMVSVADLPGLTMANGRSVPTAEDGAKVLRLTAVRNGRIDLTQFKRGAWSQADAAPFTVQEGDLLVVRGNGSLGLVGRAGLVPVCAEPIAYPDTLIRVRAAPEVVRPAWLACVWDSQPVRTHIESRARTSAGIYKISQPDIASATLPLPSIEEQDVTLAALEAAMAPTGAVEAEILSAARLAAAQRQNILRAAFSGQLVPQDPSDEPASVLLERIRADRAQPLSSLPAHSSRRLRKTTC